MAKKGENIYHRKDGRWEGRYIKGRREDGKPKFGYVYGRQYIEVKRNLTILKAKAAKNPYSVQVYQNGTLEAWVDYWLEVLTRPYVDISSYRIYKSQAERHIIARLGGMQLCEITEEVLQDFVNTVKKELAPSMVHNVFRLLKSILVSAKERKLIQEIPFGKIRRPQNRIRKPRVLACSEQARLERHIEKTGELEYLVSLYSGLRLGEVCALRWEDIDFEENMIYVNHTLKRVSCEKGTQKTAIILDRPKTDNSQREMPAPAFLMWKLRAKMSQDNAAPSDFVFQCRTGGYIDPRTMQARFARAMKKLKIRGAHFHTLRHTFATRCLEQRVGIETLSELLGHSTPQITVKYYAHCTRENKIQSIRRLETIAC